ncbi:MAG: PilN domain-containing protein [Phycisphaerae bacterium]|nr:PilN domain-containing protein [Phycisphaerae bacterium]
MSLSIDLMPRNCREVLNRRMMVRRWTLVYALTATAIFGTYWFLSLANHVAGQDRDALAIKVKINWSRNEVVNQLLKEINEIEEAVTRYNRLAWPVRASEAIDAISAATPPAVSLIELSITPKEEKPAAGTPRPDGSNKKRGASAPPSGGAAETSKVLMRIEMEGLAPDDSAVARFVSALDAHPLFSRVALEFTRAKGLAKGEVRNFRITADIDLSLRYSFTDATTGDD